MAPLRMTARLRVAAACISLVVLNACGGSTGSAPQPLPPTGSNAAPALNTGPAAAKIAEFAVPADTLPEAIAVAGDGSPWFLTLHHVNRITSSGVVTSFTGEPAPQGSGPALASYSPQNDIAIGPDKAVWFTADGSGADVNPLGCQMVALARIEANAASGALAHVLACPGSRQHGERFQSGLISGPGGTLWMVDQNGAPLGTDGSQYQSIKTDGEILFSRNLPAPCTAFGSFNPYIATGLTQGADGAVYVVAGSPCAGTGVPFASNAVIRIDAGGNVTNTFPVPDAVRITSGADRNLWVTQNGATNAIARITPGGTITEFPLPTAGAQPLGIAAGNDGAVWFTESAASKIGRITTDGKIVEFSTPTPNAQPFGIASLAGACGPGHGLIWFTEASANKIGKLEF